MKCFISQIIPTFKVLPAFCSKSLAKSRRNPCRTSNPGIDLVDFIINWGHNLDPRAAGTNNSDPLPLQIKSFSIVCGMEDVAFERLQARYFGPLPGAIKYVSNMETSRLGVFTSRNLHRSVRGHILLPIPGRLHQLPEYSSWPIWPAIYFWIHPRLLQ